MEDPGAGDGGAEARGVGGAAAPGVGGAKVAGIFKLYECEVGGDPSSRRKETLLISILLLLEVEVASAIHKVVYL